MNYRDLVEVPQIDWPDWETRFTSHGEVRDAISIYNRKKDHSARHMRDHNDWTGWLR